GARRPRPVSWVSLDTGGRGLAAASPNATETSDSGRREPQARPGLAQVTKDQQQHDAADDRHQETGRMEGRAFGRFLDDATDRPANQRARDTDRDRGE